MPRVRRAVKEKSRRTRHVAHEIQVNLERITQARHQDPFMELGRHTVDGRVVVRAFLPSAGEVTLAESNQPLRRLSGTDLFEWDGEIRSVPERYRLIWSDSVHRQHIAYDTYASEPWIIRRRNLINVLATIKGEEGVRSAIEMIRQLVPGQ